jgi:hypothetical protein
MQTKAFTSSQSLGSLLKSARDTMRKNKGLNGDLDRLPMLTWIMFRGPKVRNVIAWAEGPGIHPTQIFRAL